MDSNSKLALDIFKRAKAAKARGKEQGLSVDVAPMRVRLATQIDFSKAKPSCKRCHGTGVSHYRTEARERIGVVCSCVVKAGGVADDKFDRFARGEHAPEVIDPKPAA